MIYILLKVVKMAYISSTKYILFIYSFIYSFLINTPKLHYRSDGLKHVQCYNRHRKAYIKMKRLHLTNFTKLMKKCIILCTANYSKLICINYRFISIIQHACNINAFLMSLFNNNDNIQDIKCLSSMICKKIQYNRLQLQKM